MAGIGGEVKRIKLVVAYEGTEYCGWQVQPNGITIEGVLNNALSKLCSRNGLPHLTVHSLRHPYVKPTTKNIYLYTSAL